jgi:hypothetical protein
MRSTSAGATMAVSPARPTQRAGRREEGAQELAGPLPVELVAALRAHRWDRAQSRGSMS